MATAHQQDERRGTNVVLTADDDFSHVTVLRIPDIHDPERGFSSFKFIPGTSDHHLLALRTREVEGELESFVTVIDAHTGAVLVPDVKVADDKIEGVEFV